MCMCCYNPTLFEVLKLKCPFHFGELIKKGVQANIKDDQGATPLHFISFIDKEEYLILLIENIFEKEDDTFINSQIYTNGETCLHEECISSRRPEFINILLNNGANPNIQNKLGNTPLHYFFFYMSNKQSYESFKSLIFHGADFSILNSSGDTPLHALCKNKGTKALFFIENICKENERAFLESINKSINIQDGLGNTPLMIVCQQHKNMEICKIFIECGADINIKNNESKSCLDILGDDFIFKNSLQKIYDDYTSLDIKEPSVDE